ncbi:MAG: AAA family ATPase, partial [Campylobacteraceae bacterium]|nr:AAA family ATPase [Campylobacteraceae bacterium]
KFGYLKAEQALKLFARCSKELGLRLSQQIKEEVRQLSHLALGDFAAVMRGHRFNNIKDTREFVKRLQDEVAVKKVANEPKMGFLSS